MGCIRNHSRIWGSWLLLVSGIVYLLSANRAEARFAIKLSPTLGELYTDNIFYTKNKEARFRYYHNPNACRSYMRPRVKLHLS